jgi:hypothetical protein
MKSRKRRVSFTGFQSDSMPTSTIKITGVQPFDIFLVRIYCPKSERVFITSVLSRLRTVNQHCGLLASLLRERNKNRFSVGAKNEFLARGPVRTLARERDL